MLSRFSKNALQVFGNKSSTCSKFHLPLVFDTDNPLVDMKSILKQAIDFFG
jgi:hypothetical protein